MHAVRPRGLIPSPLTVILTVKYTLLTPFQWPTCILNLSHCVTFMSQNTKKPSSSPVTSLWCSTSIFPSSGPSRCAHIVLLSFLYLVRFLQKKKGEIFFVATPSRVKIFCGDTWSRQNCCRHLVASKVRHRTLFSSRSSLRQTPVWGLSKLHLMFMKFCPPSKGFAWKVKVYVFHPRIH